MMAFILAAVLVLAPFLLLYLAGEAPARKRRTAGHPAAAKRPRPVPAPVLRDDPPDVVLTTDEAARCEVESLLVRQRLAGEIDRGAYREAMAELAVRDARHRPLRIPGDS